MSWRGPRSMGVALALLAAACAPDAGEMASSAGPPVPDRPFETFDGGETSLADLAGEPVVVNFWASWCPPCVAEMPEFERVHLDRGDEVRFVGLNTQDDLALAEQLVARTGVTYDLGLDPDALLFNDFEVIAMPSTFFVDADGAIVHRHAGILSEQQLQSLIDEHLVG
jgi:cytochrome c biogenesis protein CcmG, thiol:disulfide interchange protein DsbE